MNERIRELAVKNAPAWMTDMSQLYPDIEKFAELIVQECALVANLHNEEAEGVNLGVGRIIKQHFGVEE